jgi:hypothetical protein
MEIEIGNLFIIFFLIAATGVKEGIVIGEAGNIPWLMSSEALRAVNIKTVVPEMWHYVA